MANHYRFWVDFPKDPARGRYQRPYTIRLPAPIPGNCVTLIVADVYPGTGQSPNTAISELHVLTDIELDPRGPEAALAEQLVRQATPGPAFRALIAAGPAAGPAILRQLKRKHPKPIQAILWRALAKSKYHGSGVGDALASGLAQAQTARAAKELSRSITELGHQNIALLASVAHRKDSTRVGRIAAIDALAGIPTAKSLTALLKTPLDDRKVRKHVVRALKKHNKPIRGILKIIEKKKNRDEPNLWRLVGYIAKSSTNRSQRQTAVSALARRLEQARAYPLYYRLLAALAAIPEADAIAAVATWIRKPPPHKQQPNAIALRRIVAAGLGDNRLTSAKRLLINLLGDPDPGVRLAAAQSLRNRTDLKAPNDLRMIAVADKDRWPSVRAAASQILAKRCHRPPVAKHLFRIASTDPHERVQIAALTSLVQCNANGVTPHLLNVVAMIKRPTKVRNQAATLLGRVQKAPRTKRLIKVYRTLVDHAQYDPDEAKIATTLATTMGKMGRQNFSRTLIKSAKTAISPKLQAASVRALGQLCAPKAKTLARALLQSQDRVVHIAARQAISRCQW